MPRLNLDDLDFQDENGHYLKFSDLTAESVQLTTSERTILNHNLTNTDVITDAQEPRVLQQISPSPLTIVSKKEKRVRFTLPPVVKLNNKQRTKFQKTFQVTIFTQQPKKFAGTNTLFSRFRASFFLLHFTEPFRVVTNNKRLKEFTTLSDRRNPSYNFAISSFINGVFRFLNFHKRFDEATRRRYFFIVRRHMIEQLTAIRRRLSNPEKQPNDNQTRTYFRFSIGRFTYYFGFHVPCFFSNCTAPPTFVTRKGAQCWCHWKKICRHFTPKPILRPPAMNNTSRAIVSRRLGVSYTKEISFSERLNKYFVVYKNFKRLATPTKQQILRFDRLTRSTASNDYKKLITENRPAVSFACLHQHHKLERPIRVSLTPHETCVMSIADIPILSQF
jgi:hypothetical protein